jgi:hypothetical protein
MGYYVRAFCTSRTVPTLTEVENALRRTLPAVRFDTDDARDSADWRNAELYYSEARGPIVLEVNVNHGPDSLVLAERQEFIEEVSNLDDSEAKARVVDHLRSVNYVVLCQLLGDIDESGFEANGELLDFFVENYGGLIQADGEGFYEGTDLVVELK